MVRGEGAGGFVGIWGPNKGEVLLHDQEYCSPGGGVPGYYCIRLRYVISFPMLVSKIR